MTVNRKFQLFMLLCGLSIDAATQNNQSLLLQIGDPAPPLKVAHWIKGEPVKEFKKGRIYVIEFWATWCGPCRMAMPHLSKLAAKYRNKVTVIGMDSFERESTSLKTVKEFVKNMGKQMDYLVATDGGFMATHWMRSANISGIPTTFVVNGDGKLVWIGHPEDNLDNVLHKVSINSFDFEETFAKTAVNKYWSKLDDSLSETLSIYFQDDPDHGIKRVVNPDAALLAIDKIVTMEPTLRYAPRIANITFRALLQTDQHKALAYAKQYFVNPTYIKPNFDLVIGGIEKTEDRIVLIPDIYQLGVEACQLTLDGMSAEYRLQVAPFFYRKMANWSSLAGDNKAAIAAHEQAYAILMKQKDFSSSEMAEYYSRLQWWLQNFRFTRVSASMDTSAGNASATGSKDQNRYLRITDDSLKTAAHRYTTNFLKEGVIGNPDSLLVYLHSIIENHPNLKYTPNVVNWTFNALIRTGQQQKAIDYGKEVLTDSNYTAPASITIAGSVNYFANRIKLLPELFQLAVQAWQVSISNISDEYIPAYAPKYYHEMALCYMHLANKEEAVKKQEKAIEILKTWKNVPTSQAEEYTAQLEKFKKQ